MTPEDVDARSQRRAKINQRRIYIIGFFVVAALLVLSANLQRQQSALADLLDQQAATLRLVCVQRQANIIKANANWDALIAVERNNRSVDPKIRNERLALFANAKLIVPDCTF